MLTCAFLMFLWIPFVGAFCGWDFDEVQENRRPTPFPDLAATSLAELPDALDAYYVDHFGFRNSFIRYWNRFLGKLDKNLLPRVIRGRGSWLFYDRPEVMLDFLGRMETTDEDLECWRAAIEGRQSWLAERGIRYLFGIAPNKPSIYPEMLPEELRVAARPTRLDRLMAYMEANSDVRILDMRPALLAAKGWKTLYLSNDTHWNNYGAFVGYRAVITRLREWFPELDPPLELSECRITTAPFLGDLAQLADLPRDEYTIPRDTIYPPTLDSFETVEFIDSALTSRGLLPDGPNEKPMIYRNPSGHGRAVVFHDSFFYRAAKLVAHHFAETTFISPRLTPEVLASVVEKQKPDVVVEVHVERSLYRVAEQNEAWEEARCRRGSNTTRKR